MRKLKYIGDDKKLEWWTNGYIYEVFESNGHRFILDDEGDKLIINEITMKLFEVIE